MSRQSLKIANIAALAAMFIAVINLVVFREIWVLVIAMIFVVTLAVYSVNEKRKLSKKPEGRRQKHGS